MSNHKQITLLINLLFVFYVVFVTYLFIFYYDSAQRDYKKMERAPLQAIYGC